MERSRCCPSEDDLTEILQDKSTADFVLSEGGDEASAVKLHRSLRRCKHKQMTCRRGLLGYQKTS